MMTKTWLKEVGITDVNALFSLEDASVIQGWSNRIYAVTTKSYMRGYRDIYKNVNLLHKMLIKFCDSKVNMNIVKVEFQKEGQ